MPKPNTTPPDEINIVDLFCGCGGNMSGCHDAIREMGYSYSGLAINHCKVAVDTMRRNFPDVTTLNCKIEEAVPGKLIGGRTIHLLWASPSCTHHSRACGGRPRSDQLRSQPEYVTTWLAQCDVRCLIVENVPEFMEWGPLDEEDKPIKDKRGQTFRAWVAMIESLGYQVKYKILNCADFGDATTRRRFFLMATKEGLPEPMFPEPTHGDNVRGRKQWRPIKECLDFTNTGKSIFNRSRPLARNTLRRIAVGARKYWGLDVTDDMLEAACGHGGNLKDCSPFIVKLRNNCTVDSIDKPLSTITCGGRHHALCTPHLVVNHRRHGRAEPPDRPCRTITTHDSQSLVTLVLGQHGGSSCRTVDEPCPTVCVKGAVRAITPVLIDMSHPKEAAADDSRVYSARRPMKTLTTRNNTAVVSPVEVDSGMCGSGTGTLLVLDDGRRLDIHIRMLTPEEYAKAHSFPDDFVLTGNRTERTKQVGNSVPARTAKALCGAILRELVA